MFLEWAIGLNIMLSQVRYGSDAVLFRREHQGNLLRRPTDRSERV